MKRSDCKYSTNMLLVKYLEPYMMRDLARKSWQKQLWFQFSDLPTNCFSFPCFSKATELQGRSSALQLTTAGSLHQSLNFVVFSRQTIKNDGSEHLFVQVQFLRFNSRSISLFLYSRMQMLCEFPREDTGS